jgi:hypothetical protein
MTSREILKSAVCEMRDFPNFLKLLKLSRISPLISLSLSALTGRHFASGSNFHEFGHFIMDLI